jgi:hypothetical protein
LAINKSGCQIWHVFDAAMTTASFDQLMWCGATWPCQGWCWIGYQHNPTA